MLNLYDAIQTLRLLQNKGGKRYSDITALLALDPTTHNVEQVFKYLAKAKGEIDG